jgi:tRNA(Ile2) C34 agmatinyltransferase TiaS
MKTSETKYVTCPKCGFKAISYFYTCPTCSYNFTSGTFHDEVKRVLAQRVEGKCPFCHSEIQAEVVKCGHCGEWLSPSQRQLVEKAIRAQIATGGVAKFIAALLVISILSQIVILLLSR